MNRQSGRNSWTAFVTIVSVALLVRVVYLIESASNPTFQLPLIDSETYDRLARHLVAGGGLTEEFFWQPVFYPLFLSGVYLVSGGSILAAKLVQIILGALTCGLTYRLGQVACDRRTGLVAGLLAAFCGPLLFFDAELLATGWAAYWSVALLLAFLSIGRRAPLTGDSSPRNRWRLAAVAGLGICLGLATITRPTFLPFALAGTAWLGVRWHKDGAGGKSTLVALVILLAGFLVVAVPVTAMAAQTTGRATFLPTSAGLNLFLGNNPERAKTVNIRPGWEWESLTRSPRLQGVSEQKETSRYFAGRVRDYVRSDPGGYLGGLTAKSAEMISSREIPRNLDIYLFRDWSTTLGLLVWKIRKFGFPVGILLPFAVLGLVRPRARIPAPVHLFLWLYGGAVVLVFVSSRYRTPILPVLCVLAAAGILWLTEAYHRHRWAELAIGGGVLAVVLPLVTIPGPFPQEQQDLEAELYSLVGRRARDRGDLADAEQSQRRALAVDPGHANANTALANLLDSRGSTDEAVEYYEKALEAEPDHAIALANLGRVLARQGNHAAALRHLEKAIEVTPLDADLYEDCATVLARQGRLGEALEYLDRALRIRPEDTDLHYRRGRVLGALNRVDAAREAYETSLQLDGLNQQALDALAALLVRGRNREEALELYRSALERTSRSGRTELEQRLRARVESLERQQR